MADEELQDARERAELLLTGVADDVTRGQATLALIFSLIEAEDEDIWLREKLDDALRD